MSWLSELFEPKMKSEATPTIMPEQQRLLGDLSSLIRGLPSQSDFTIPQAWLDAPNYFGPMIKAAESLPKGSTPWLETSPEQTVARWEKYLKAPMMSAWEQTAGPYAQRKYNLPGSFYSADASRGMMREAQQYLGSNLLPSLYSSQENMFNRLFGLAGGLATGQTMNVDTIGYPSTFQNVLQGGSGILALLGML